MARQVLPKTSATSKNPTAGVAVTFTAGDTVNFEQFVLTGKELILIWNTHASLAGTFTITSVADERGRTGDITTQSIAFGTIYTIGPLDLVGWAQTNQNLYLQVSAATMRWAVILLP
jgi:hypothetical protein